MEISPLTLSLNNFSLSLYNSLSAGKDENFFISPFSISTALSMCLVGARNETATQLKNLLHLNSLSDSDILNLNQKLIESLNNLGNDVQLNTANKIYPQIGYNVKQDFTDAIKKNFHSEVQTLDFSQSQESANVINKWVSDKTKDKIPKLISPDLLDNLTRLVLVNAIYFKGLWANQFDKNKTAKDDFHLRDGSTQKVDMMKILDKKFKLAKNPGGLAADTCEFPYQGNSIAMTILLPNEGVSIDQIEKQLTNEKLKEVFDTRGRLGKVYAFIPKFKLEYEAELSEKLIALGANLPFDQNQADFSGINSDNEGLHISKVVHKAVVEVNEEGTEAAAATGVVMAVRCAMIEFPPEEFKCNRPFLFVIHDVAHRNVLFLGKYIKPQ